MLSAAIMKALADERRSRSSNWLKDPTAHFPSQSDGDLVKDGVCSLFIADKLGVSAPTASEHLRVLSQAGLIGAKRVKKWTIYKRNEPRIREVKQSFRQGW